jgi:hypothetical protein
VSGPLPANNRYRSISNDPPRKKVYVPCKICHKIFSTNNLGKHLKTHEGRKDYECSKCNKYFVSKQSLEHHIDTIHLTVKNNDHKCTICNKTFSSKACLNAHIRSVHVDKSHKCDLCDAAFKTNQTLIAHVKGVHQKIKHVRNRNPKEKASTLANYGDIVVCTVAGGNHQSRFSQKSEV